jgi:6-phosphogluconolactonase (cycloisomerase 2 family)
LGDIENSFRVPEDTLQIAGNFYILKTVINETILAHLQLSQNGKFVLVSNRGRHNSISIFKIVDPKEGKLELASTVSTQGYFPRFFTLIEDKYLLIANQVNFI